MNGGDDFFTLSEFELFRLRFLERGGFFPIDPFARRFRFPGAPQFRPSASIPRLVAPATAQVPSILATVPTRGASLSDQSEPPMPFPVGVAFPRLVAGPPRAPAGPVTITQALQQSQETPMALDLGNILTTLGGKFIETRFGGGRAPPAPIGATPAFNLFDPFGLTDTGVAAAAVCPPQDDTSLGKLQSCRVDPCTGVVTLVKRRRRRRRSLATARDIKDIAALMGVANVKSSQPQLVTTWIATRGGR